MSIADVEFRCLCEDILENGISDEGQNVRTVWPDGTPAHTIAKFGVVQRYNLQEEYPVLTLRKSAIKSATDEMLWIFQKKSNRVSELGSHVWDQWADKEGTIGKAYGYQLGVKHRCKDVTEDGLKAAFPGYTFFDAIVSANQGLFSGLDQTFNPTWSRKARVCQDPNTGRIAAVYDSLKTCNVWYMDQVDKVIYDLINNPFSRRIMTSIWNPAEFDDMMLPPCAWNVSFMVQQRPGHDKLTLNMVLNQRSQDVLSALDWNSVQYSMLQTFMAQVAGMEVGEFMHVITNGHIYDRHVPIVRELIQRDPQPAPKVWVNPEIKDFYAFTKDDVELRDYQVAGPQVKFEVAI